MMFVVSPLAARDLDDIWNYLADDNLEATDRVLLGLEKAMNKLAKRPGVGHLREDLADRRHRFFLVYSYLIAYRQETKPLQIIRVMHAARDIQTLLELSPETLEPATLSSVLSTLFGFTVVATRKCRTNCDETLSPPYGLSNGR